MQMENPFSNNVTNHLRVARHFLSDRGNWTRCGLILREGGYTWRREDHSIHHIQQACASGAVLIGQYVCDLMQTNIPTTASAASNEAAKLIIQQTTWQPCWWHRLLINIFSCMPTKAAREHRRYSDILRLQLYNDEDATYDVLIENFDAAIRATGSEPDLSDMEISWMKYRLGLAGQKPILAVVAGSAA